jgi:DNA (cytosine-5)-methyltransferase 1
MLTFGSLFAGIGGADLGFERAGMTCAWQVEIDAKCRTVLERHWPDVDRSIVDVRRANGNTRAVDLICGGFPCQDVSVAGKREGLAGERSGLWFQFLRILTELTPRWVVVENVPGLLSSNGGRDFAVILRGLAQLGYGVCWRVLDAQYFGVAQRRRRVFVVGHLGDGRAAEVLFESESCAWDPAPSREAGKGTTAYTPAGFAEYRQGIGTLRHNHRDCGGGSEMLIAPPLTHHSPRNNVENEAFIAFDKSRGTVSGAITAPLRVNGGRSPRVNDGKADNQCVAYGLSENQRAELRLTPYSRQITSGGGKPGQGYPCVATVSPCLNKESYSPTKSSSGQMVDFCIGSHMGVRRLTPTECERLQGFPDGHTAGQSDSARYRQLGNAVCVPVAEWLGRRIVAADALTEG